MTAQQGIDLLAAIKLQLSSDEEIKFQNMILEQVEERKQKRNQCLAKLIQKHAKNQKLKFK